MEPHVSSPDASGERQLPPRGEQLAPLQPERSAPSTPEVAGESREQSTGAGRGDAPPMAPPPVPLPPPLPPASDAANQPASSLATPSIASDDDLIEKEWVDKAKQIIADTRHDPHLQEQQVSQLQADYLQKRYGKTIKESDSE